MGPGGPAGPGGPGGPASALAGGSLCPQAAKSNTAKIGKTWRCKAEHLGAMPLSLGPRHLAGDKVSRADTLGRKGQRHESCPTSIENLESCFEMAPLRRKLGDSPGHACAT